MQFFAWRYSQPEVEPKFIFYSTPFDPWCLLNIVRAVDKILMCSCVHQCTLHTYFLDLIPELLLKFLRKHCKNSRYLGCLKIKNIGMLPMQELFFSSWVGWSMTLCLTDVFIFVKEKEYNFQKSKKSITLAQEKERKTFQFICNKLTQRCFVVCRLCCLSTSKQE